MEAGGNAVDGAIAANAVLAVVLPDTCGPGGDLFALIHHPGSTQPVALNASGRAGSGADPEVLRRAGYREIPARSIATITVPGCVDGWESLSGAEGSLSLEEVLSPAIALATDGFPVSTEFAMSLERLATLLESQASAIPLYPEGRPPLPGDTLRRPRLAQTLQSIAIEGRDAFYGGAVGAEITRVTAGVITPADLAVRQTEWVRPIGVDVFGLTAWTVPPNSQGYLTLATAWIFERLVAQTDPHDPRFQHGLIEAYRAVAWEREDLVSEPAAARTDPRTLLSDERLARRAKEIDLTQAMNWPAPRSIPGGTAYLCTRDGSGMGVSLIQSNYHGIGTGISAGDTGVFLHDRGGGFNLFAGHPNELGPGKRPLHTLSPTLWTSGTALAALLGTRGGEYQPQLLAQVAANLFHAGQTAPEALAAPRWLVDGWQGGGPHRVRIEPGHQNLSPALSRLGHTVDVVDAWQPGWGPVSLIVDEGVTTTAAADPRVTTAAAVSSA
jgi:gamma-glutamyltranspeptidase/glutathione hydrolase